MINHFFLHHYTELHYRQWQQAATIDVLPDDDENIASGHEMGKNE